MGVFRFFKKNKAEPTDEQKKWNKMWDLWAEGRADSPYAELMTYQSEMAILETALPAKLRENLQNAYNAYRKLTNEESGEQTETMLS